MKHSLSVHRNTIEARRKRELARSLQRDTERLVREHDIRAYAIIGIGADGKGYALWDTGAILPMWAFPGTMAAILSKDMEASDMDDDWKPPINLKGSISHG